MPVRCCDVSELLQLRIIVIVARRPLLLAGCLLAGCSPGALWSDTRTPVDHLEWRYCSDYSGRDGDERPSKSTRPENPAERRQQSAGDLPAAGRAVIDGRQAWRHVQSWSHRH